jgi:hypothetical protein
MDKVDLADLQILTTQALNQVGGGCASCDQQMNPPSSLDVTRAQQVMNQNIDFIDERIMFM